MDSNLSPKISKKYCCELCDYYTSKSTDFKKHVATVKHQNIENDSKMGENGSIKSQKVAQYECKCGKIYKYDSGYYRHKKTCISTQSIYPTEENIITKEPSDKEPSDKEANDKEPSDKELILLLIKENAEFKNMMMKVLENGTHNTTNNTNHTNSHNKAFNLQFFLNETCKDAMNIMDFVESIQLQLSDLENVGEVGYVEGISNIIVKNLKELDVTQRPVHCTDKKRETIYIKDENKWEKDDEKNKIRKMIKRVASKNQRLLLKFKELHPDCSKYHSKYSDQYNKLIVESMGGSGNNDLEKEDKIIRNIVKNVVVDKDA
jgi:hypothetical protein